MAEAIVTFRATVNGLIIIMREEDDFKSILEQIEEKIRSAGRFFKGASIDVKYRGKRLGRDEEEKVFQLLSEKTGAEIKSVEEDREEPPKPQESEASKQKMKMKKCFFKEIDEGATKFYRGTVRSGQLIRYEGNLVVIGDVNPGGEVVASGNVIVMGALRGIVHAGADGNKEAIVAAFNLQPMQLRIADVITRSPDEEEGRNALVPEMAFVKDDAVYIERFLPQR